MNPDIGGRYGQYIQDPSEQIFNNGQTIFSIRGIGGTSNIGIYNEGSKHMWSQDFIHNYFPFANTPTFKSTAKSTYGVSGSSGF